jgi:hypothetical protein
LFLPDKTSSVASSTSATARPQNILLNPDTVSRSVHVGGDFWINATEQLNICIFSWLWGGFSWRPEVAALPPLHRNYNRNTFTVRFSPWWCLWIKSNFSPSSSKMDSFSA